MSDYVQERYNPVQMGVNATYTIPNGSIGCFLCQTSGTLTLTRGNTAVPVLTNFPVTSGQYLRIPFLLGIHGGTVTLAGGASGTLGVG